MMNFKRLFTSVFCAALCLAVMLTSAVFLLRADESFSMTASKVTDGAFTVTVDFPKVDWNTYNLVITYDPAKIQTAKPTYSVGGTVTTENIDGGNATGTYKLGALALTPISGGFSITLPFTVKDANATEVQISMSVTEFALNGTAIGATAASPITVTLKTVTPPPSSDTSTNTSTTETSSDSSESDSDTTGTTSTDSEKPTISTNTSTDSDKPTVSTSTKTSTKTSGTTDSDGTTDKTSASDTDSDQITDSETGFPFSSGSGSNTDDPTTDVTDLPGSDSESETTVTGPTIVVPSTSTLKQPTDDGKIATSTVAIISIGVAALLCAGLTVLGLMRHKKVD